MKRNKMNILIAAMIILMAICALSMAVNADHTHFVEVMRNIGI